MLGDDGTYVVTNVQESEERIVVNNPWFNLRFFWDFAFHPNFSVHGHVGTIREKKIFLNALNWSYSL